MQVIAILCYALVIGGLVFKAIVFPNPPELRYQAVGAPDHTGWVEKPAGNKEACLKKARQWRQADYDIVWGDIEKNTSPQYGCRVISPTGKIVDYIR